MPTRSSLTIVALFACWTAGLRAAEEMPAEEMPAEEMSAEARAFLDRALDLMQEQSVKTREIDWVDLRARTFQQAAGARTTADTYAALTAAIDALGDGHSFLITKDGGSSWALEPDDLPKEPVGRRLDGGFGYVLVPGYLGMDASGNEAFARSIQRVIAEADAGGVKGWVVDLRYDTGGNMWPMLAGLAPILGDGPCGAFVNADGGRSVWYVSGGEVGVNDKPFLDLGDEAVRLTHEQPIVAVLTGKKTASSGEAVAVAFRGRADTRSFGEGTAGVSTANNTLWLGDGSMLFLTVAVDSDRTGALYGGVIDPDETVDAPLSSTPAFERDPVVQAALEWLNGQVAEARPELGEREIEDFARERDLSVPEVFSPGVISTVNASENTLSFSDDGLALFSRTDGWSSQRPLLSTFEDGAWTEPGPPGFADEVYNAHLSADGAHVLWAIRDANDEIESFMVEREEDRWSEPVSLSLTYGIRGSYFCLLPEALYFHVDGDLFRAPRVGAGFGPPARLGPPINTSGGVEFGAWVDPEERLMIFTRGIEGDQKRSGLFLSQRQGRAWAPPRRLPLAYGWSPTISTDGQYLHYTTDQYSADLDIVRVRLSAIGVLLPAR